VVLLETIITVSLQIAYGFFPPHLLLAFLFFVVFIGLSTLVDESYDLVHSLIFFFQTLMSFQVIEVSLAKKLESLVPLYLLKLRISGLECLKQDGETLAPGSIGRYWLEILTPLILVFLVVLLFATVFICDKIVKRLKDLVQSERINSFSQLREFTFYTATEDERKGSIQSSRDTYESDDLFFGAEAQLSEKEDVKSLIRGENNSRLTFDMDRGIIYIYI
jgi:hypothetical protein